MIKIETKLKLTATEYCQMCKKLSSAKFIYRYHSQLSDTKLNICYKCAIREYYGTKYTLSKKWKKDKEDGKLFGRDNNRN